MNECEKPKIFVEGIHLYTVYVRCSIYVYTYIIYVIYHIHSLHMRI